MTNKEIIEELKKLLYKLDIDEKSRNEISRRLEDSGNREYKDSLFVYLFGNEKYKRFTLELYNAINGTHYTDEDEVEITTLEKVVYINVKNDVSFLLSGKMNFYEHQSTYAPNIPIRMLIYSAKVYDRYIHEKRFNIYGKTRYELPAPKCVCFYNGVQDMDDRVIMKLSDSISGEDKGDIEVKVTALNINSGHNPEIMRASKTLGDYSMFVENVRKYSKETDSLKKAIDKAIKDMPEDSEVGEILRNNRAEVVSMCLEEYTQEYVNELHEIELERFKKRADQAETRADKAEARANKAEADCEAEKNRADKAEAGLEAEKNRADDAETKLARYREKYGILD